jgi:hypothetical protein
MDRAWAGHGDIAIDTHTHPGSRCRCAALAVLDEIESRRCRSERWSWCRWRSAPPAVRGRGLALACPAMRRLLRPAAAARRIAVPAGRDAELERSPPLTIEQPQLVDALALVAEAVA